MCHSQPPVTWSPPRPGRGPPSPRSISVVALEHVEAVIAGAESVVAPVVLQVSENAVKFRYGRLLPLARAAAAAAERASVPVALHLDHVQSDDLLPPGVRRRQLGDVQREPGCRRGEPRRHPGRRRLGTHKACGSRPSWGRWEAGRVSRRSTRTRPAPAPDPAEARAFVADSGVDALAVAIGSSHAMTTRTAALDHDRLKRLTAALGVPLVLHGSSGVPDDELAVAIAGGIAKVNVGTALNIAMTGAVREFLAAHPEAVDSRKYLAWGGRRWRRWHA